MLKLSNSDRTWNCTQTIQFWINNLIQTRTCAPYRHLISCEFSSCPLITIAISTEIIRRVVSRPRSSTGPPSWAGPVARFRTICFGHFHFPSLEMLSILADGKAAYMDSYDYKLDYCGFMMIHVATVPSCCQVEIHWSFLVDFVKDEEPQLGWAMELRWGIDLDPMLRSERRLEHTKIRKKCVCGC